MTLVPYDVKKLRIGGRADNYSLIEEFINSNMDCAKIEGYSQKSASVCTASLNATIKRYRRHTIKAITRNGEVYLVRKKILEKDT